MLQKLPLRIDLTNGIDQKHDELLVLPTKLALAQNALFGEQGTLETRPGFDGASTGSVATWRLSKFRETLLTERSNGLFAESGKRCDPVGSSGYQGFTRADAVVTPILGTAETVNPSNVDCAKGASTSCWVSGTTNIGGYTGIVGTIINDADGSEAAQFLLTDTSGVNQYLRARILPSTTAGQFHLYCVKLTAGPTRQLVHFTVSADGTLSSATNVGAVLAGTLYDVAPDTVSNNTDKFTIATYKGTGDIQILSVSATDGVTVGATVSVTPSIGVETLCAVTTYDGTTKRHCAFFSQSNDTLYACGMTAAGVAITQKTIVALGGGGRIGRMSACDEFKDSGNVSVLGVAVDFNAAGAYATPPTPDLNAVYILQVGKDLVSTVATKAIIKNMFLATRLRVHTDGRATRALVGTFRLVDNDSTTFLFDAGTHFAGGATNGTPPICVARLAIGETSAFGAGSWNVTVRVPDTATTAGSGQALFPIMRFVSSLQESRGSNVTPVALCRAEVNTASSVPGFIELQNGTLLYGGCPHWYDGRNIVEQGFHYRPILSGSAHSGAAGSVSAGTYQFYATFAWSDSLGNWHESAPSDLLTVTGVLANQTITFTASAYNPSWKQQNVLLVIYRTEANGSVFYRDQTVANFTVALTLSVSSGGSDSGLLGGSLVPISGDVLENEPLPSMRHAFLWHNRLWMSGCNDGYDLHFSQELTEGFGIEFNSELIRRSSAAFGRVVATEDQGQRLAIFGEERTGFLYGTGPTRTGDQDNYSEVEPGDTVVGTVWESPRAVLGTPEGVWFPTERGMRLLLDDGNLARAQDGAEVGSELDALVDAVAPTALIASHCQLRRELWVWAFGKLAAFVWNYEWKQWTEQIPGGDFDGLITDGVDVAGVPTFSENSTGYAIGTLGTTIFDPGSTEAQTTLETPWLQVAGVQGFERVYKMVVIGKLLSSTGVVSVEITAAFDFAAFGAADVTATVTSNANGFIQFEHPFATQKCQAMKLRMRITPGSTRFRLTNLTFLVGIKKGVVKLPSSQRI